MSNQTDNANNNKTATAESGSLWENCGDRFAPKFYNAKPLTVDRAVYLIGQLMNRFDGDDDRDMLLELIMGLPLPAGEAGKDDYHYELSLHCVPEAYKHTSHASNAMVDYLLLTGLAEIMGDRKAKADSVVH